jgi:hypothetical protein
MNKAGSANSSSGDFSSSRRRKELLTFPAFTLSTLMTVTTSKSSMLQATETLR